MKRTVNIVAIALAVLLLFTGCGNSSSSSSPLTKSRINIDSDFVAYDQLEGDKFTIVKLLDSVDSTNGQTTVRVPVYCEDNDTFYIVYQINADKSGLSMVIKEKKSMWTDTINSIKNEADSAKQALKKSGYKCKLGIILIDNDNYILYGEDSSKKVDVFK